MFIYQINSSIYNKTFDWSFTESCQTKQHYDTWIPKKSDLIVYEKDEAIRNTVLEELWEDMQPDNQFIRDRINAKARARRKKNNV
jgi:hypothetical protein